MFRIQLGVTWMVVLAAACGDDGEATPDACIGCEPIDASPADANPMPTTLAESGLCANAACTEFVAGVREYTPAFGLWTDGASKRRWIYLPSGAQINTSDWDDWKFPAGAKLWKEFSRDGLRVETRLYSKSGPGDDDWYFVSYAWNQAQTEAVAVPTGMMDTLGTPHDIPSRSQCRQCHDQVNGRILGFSAIQLDVPAPSGQISLEDAITGGWLSALPATLAPQPPRMPLPGSDLAKAALGYLHANCGHCHNPRSGVHGVVPVELRLESGRLATVEATPTYTTAVGIAPDGITAAIPTAGLTLIVDGGSPATSLLHWRFAVAGPAQRMPKTGTEVVDPVGSAAISDWILSLP